MELLKQLYKIHSPSGSERVMKKFIRRYVRRQIPGAKIRTDKIGNLYIIKGIAPSYPCIVAHLDQVQWNHSTDFRPIETKELIFGYCPSQRKQEGIGADDKNGIWIALRCLKEYDILKVAFFVEEETGCRGSSQADLEFFEDARFVIQPDRRGYKDLITHIGWTDLCSDEFLKATGYEQFGYQETEGAMTDILALKENGLEISCINLSCGYYEPHTDNEFTVKADLLNCLRLIEHIIETCTGVYPHKSKWGMTDDPWRTMGQISDWKYEEIQTEIYEMLEVDETLSVDDLVFMYGQYYPELRREDFERIYTDYHEFKSIENQDYGIF